MPPRLSRVLGRWLLTCTIIIAFLNAILRLDTESAFTAYRLLLPLVIFVVAISYVHRELTYRYARYTFVAAAYLVLQSLVLGTYSNSFSLSYIANIIALVMFMYLVHVYLETSGPIRFQRLLFAWCLLIVLLSLHQLATGVEYPVVPRAEHDLRVARIFFGQENDTSLAIASFMPFLFHRALRRPLSLLLFIAGIFVIAANGSRGTLLSMALYPLFLLFGKLIGAVSGRVKYLSVAAALLLLAGAITTFLWYKDAPLPFVGSEGESLEDLVLTPLAEIVAGQVQDEQITSVGIRVTMAVVGISAYLSTFGFGIGAGSMLPIVESYFPGVAKSMHVFPLQMLTECGWLFLGTLVLVFFACVRRRGVGQVLPVFAYYMAVSLSINSGAITNYFYFACAMLACWYPELLYRSGPGIRLERHFQLSSASQIPSSASATRAAPRPSTS